jgi:sigma-E factor negative regulatory protein RseC
MAEHIGIVIKTESGNYAHVLADRKGACGGCQSTPSGCHSCLTSAKMESRVSNPVSAKAGDLVKIRLSSTDLLTGAAILYLLPILGLLIGAFIGVLASTAFGLAEIIGSIGGALTGLFVGYVAVITLDRSPSIRRRITPTITAIVSPNVGIPDLKKA